MSTIAAVVALVAFAVALIMGWDDGLTLGAFRAICIGLIALVGAWFLDGPLPWAKRDGS